MFSLSRKWMIVVLAVWAIKLILVPLPPLNSDFLNWIGGSQQVFNILSNGKLPSVGAFGAYLGLYVFLAPFYWLWTLLPIQHATLAEMVTQTQPSLARYSLLYVMKIPIIVCDFFTGLLAFRLVGKLNPSRASKAFLSWHLNPFNWYWLYWFTTMDVVPAVIVLLAIQYGMNRKWSRCGLCLSLATILRLYPIFLLPFFAVFALWVEGRSATRSLVHFASAFVVPIFLGMVVQGLVIGSFAAPLNTLLRLPVTQPEVADFLGFRLATFFTFTPFLLVLQLYVSFSCWKKNTALVLLVLAPLLVFFASGIGLGLWLIWASALLSIYYALDNDLLLFSLTFLSGFLSPITMSPLFIRYFGYNIQYQGDQPVIDLLGPCMSGIHYGAKIIYLLKLNLSRLRAS
jgi:hypothetical protein